MWESRGEKEEGITDRVLQGVKGNLFICGVLTGSSPCGLEDIMRACGACDSGSNPDRGMLSLALKLFSLFITLIFRWIYLWMLMKLSHCLHCEIPKKVAKNITK